LPFPGETVDKFGICGKISLICKRNAEARRRRYTQARGERWEPFVDTAFSHFQAARDDRDGFSRYRETKMLLLERIRVVPRFTSPLCQGVAFYYFVLILEVMSNG